MLFGGKKFLAQNGLQWHDQPSGLMGMCPSCQNLLVASLDSGGMDEDEQQSQLGDGLIRTAQVAFRARRHRKQAVLLIERVWLVCSNGPGCSSRLAALLEALPSSLSPPHTPHLSYALLAFPYPPPSPPIFAPFL